jgi:pSer/pThr/pTyr-binding forkhead associated (FHA) protein
MKRFVLTFESEDEFGEISLDEGKVSFGRGSEADHRFQDDGLSRLHATVYCEDERVWVVDENSSNGTFVNGNRVGESGSPLEEGDVIKIGHYSNLSLSEVTEKSAAEPETAPARQIESSSANSGAPPILIPLVVIGVAVLLIVSAIAIIGIPMIDTPSDERAGGNDPDDPYGDLYRSTPGPDKTATPPPGNTTSTTSVTPTGPGNPTPEPTVTSSTPGPALPTKQYRQMSTEEKNLYIKIKAEKVAGLIGNKNTGDIPPAAIASIKRFVDQYANRFRAKRLDDCRGRGSFTRSDMQSVLDRAAKNVPFITRSFRSQAVDPQVGIYVAMIESEHCVCLQSGTGPLGMFQFTKATGEAFGLQVRRGATPSNPDERCEPLPASLASAKYLKYLSGRIGTGPLSVPLAIASYNSGEGGLGKNLMTALTRNNNENRSFWTLVANADALSKQFKSENIKYVPKFFAAAIVGENPRDFGSASQPLSTYSR